jgi:hypothetical protein
MSSHTAASEFWQETERYHELAETFETNIERTHPDIVTSDNQLCFPAFVSWCDWCASSVDYYEYRGPSV